MVFPEIKRAEPIVGHFSGDCYLGGSFDEKIVWEKDWRRERLSRALWAKQLAEQIKEEMAWIGCSGYRAGCENCNGRCKIYLAVLELLRQAQIDSGANPRAPSGASVPSTLTSETSKAGEASEVRVGEVKRS